MKRVWLWLAGLVSLFLLVRCASVTQPSTSVTWINNMHRLSTAYLQLMPYVADGKEFSDPKNRTVIQRNLRELQAASAQIAHDPQPPNADPIIAYTATRFAVEMRQANAAFEYKDFPWAKHSLARASDYCINCHTSINQGAKDFPIAWHFQLAGLPETQKIEALLATRQYASALALANSFVRNETAVKTNPRAWQLTIERVMATVIRINDDSAEAMQLATLALYNKAAPFYIRNDAAAWFEDIKAWKNEKVPATDRARLKSAEKLVVAASARPHMSANLIPSLRASALLHGMLQIPKSSRRGEVLMQAGLVAQSLRDINLGYLDQYYFEECVRAKPHTDLAEDCFVQLETSVRDSNIFSELEPDSVYATDARLAELRQLAEVKDPEAHPGWKARIWNYDIDEMGRPERKKERN